MLINGNRPKNSTRGGKEVYARPNLLLPDPTLMSVIRNRRADHFTIVPNPTLRDPTLSLQAKGLLAVMLSFPDDWSYNLSHIQELNQNGRDAHRSALRELIDAGYAKWETVHNADGTLSGRELIVSDRPGFEVSDRGTESQADGESTVGLENRRTGKPSDGKSDATKNERPTKNEGTKTVDDVAHAGSSAIYPLARFDQFEKIGVRMTRGDAAAEAAALAITGSHPDLWRRLSRIRRKHKPEAVTWSEWVKAAGEWLEEYGPDKLASAIDSTLATPNVRNPHALLGAVLRDARPSGSARSRSGAPADGMDSLRERYPEAFQ